MSLRNIIAHILDLVYNEYIGQKDNFFKKFTFQK